MSFLKGRVFFLAAAWLAMAAGVWPESAKTVAPVTLTAAEVVEQMRLHNLARVNGLKSFKELRHYQVDYRGLTTLSGQMEVEVIFDTSTGKTFRIVSQSGSKFLCDRVLKRLVESEQEAGKDKSTTALTAANYRFESAGSEIVEGRMAYVLNVEPLVANKFLYVGKIWVDAADFAVAKIEAVPSKSPSFWIRQTLIHHTYGHTGGFWLPSQNRTVTKVRLGGTAVLTIDYGTYETEPQIAADASSLAAGR